MDMDYLAENSYKLIYFGTILDPSSELQICSFEKASGRWCPHLPDEDGFFHPSLLPIWFLCWESYTLPVDHVVYTGGVVHQRRLVDLCERLFSPCPGILHPFSCFKSILCSFCLTSSIMALICLFTSMDAEMF